MEAVPVKVDERVTLGEDVPDFVCDGVAVPDLVPDRVATFVFVCECVTGEDGVDDDDTDALALEVEEPDADDVGVPEMVELGDTNGSRETVMEAVIGGVIDEDDVTDAVTVATGE